MHGLRKIYQRRCLEPSGVLKKRIRIAIVLGIFVILLAGMLVLYYHNPRQLMLACPVYALTGLYCPGCGAGRACYAILHGRLYQAFRYNPLLCILLPWLALYYLIGGIQWLRYGRERISARIPEWIPLAAIFLLLAYGAVRNIGIYPFTLLAPTTV